MRIIKEKFLLDTAAAFPKAEKYLAAWRAIVKSAAWHNMTELRQTYPSADLVKLNSGNSVVVFNVCGNTYRLIAAVHFNTQLVYTLRFLTHAEYSRDTWKQDL